MTKWDRQRTDWRGDRNPHYKGGPRALDCAKCGTTIYRWPSVISKRKHHFCSTQCHDDFRRKPKRQKGPRNPTGIQHPRWSGTKVCKICGVELFERRQRQAFNCRSEECLSASKTRNKSGAKNGRWLGGQYPICNCKQCGKTIIGRASMRRVFCSRTCQAKWNSENRSGENSPIWKGPGKRASEEYSPKWTPKLRYAIRRRDDFKCQNCGVHKRGLDVHHIDKDKWNCDPSNLISLCRSCHRFIEGGSIPCPQLIMLSLA